MKIKEPASMAEIHTIRERMHAETEGMSIHDLLNHVSKEAEAFKSKHKLKLRTRGKKEPVGA